MTKRVLERQREERPKELLDELEALKQTLRARAGAVAQRERELERHQRKLELHERRLGRKLRLLRAQRSWFAPVKAKVAERADEGSKLERRAA